MFIENGDSIDDKTRDPNHLKLLKLHGCITRTANPIAPLILTPDQYIQHRRGRSRLFDQFRDWGYEHTIIFIGHSLQDPDLRTLLLELIEELGELRPRFYAVTPNIHPVEERSWERKKVTLLRGSFVDFMQEIDHRIEKTFRGLAVTVDCDLPIAEKFRVHDPSVSPGCQNFLQTDVDYVKGVKCPVIYPKDFYRGVDPGFAAIEQGLDVSRSLSDTILAEHFLVEESAHQSQPELVLIKAEAGAGKSVLLRRVAWDAAHEYGYICLYLRQHGHLNLAAIEELIDLCKQRVFLFVDDIADHVWELTKLLDHIGTGGSLLTVVTAERINEWNVACEALSPAVTESYELRYLSSSEIDRLLKLLEKNDALHKLEPLSPTERKQELEERAGRQLLVALHEATLGLPFEEIIEDEFRSIVPYEAQRMYLTICVLNRLNVPVRAGIVSRIHGVPFSEFKNKFLSPLEKVVITSFDPASQDYCYRARHPHIAQLVFDRILSQPEDRFDMYLRCLNELNIDYSSDSRAFRQMIRARIILELFPNHNMALDIFQAARKRGGDESFLLQQRAIYELHRPNGNMHEAGELLAKAQNLRPQGTSIKHSRAELLLRLAESARSPLQRETHLKEATSICKEYNASRPSNSYGYHTLAKIGLQRLKTALSLEAQDVSDLEIEELVKAVEEVLQQALQRFPGDSYVLDTEANLAEFLNDSDRALTALENSFSTNPRSTYVAVRLAGCYARKLDESKGIATLKRALDANPGNERLHYAYGKLILDKGDCNELLYHLHRAYSPGDGNYDAQLLHARQLFICGDFAQSKKIFAGLSRAHVRNELRLKLRCPLAERFTGEVSRQETNYCFIIRDGPGDSIYAHLTQAHKDVRDRRMLGLRVQFRIGFNFRGPTAYEVDLEHREN